MALSVSPPHSVAFVAATIRRLSTNAAARLAANDAPRIGERAATRGRNERWR
jgi:hypothetical protein